MPIITALTKDHETSDQTVDAFAKLPQVDTGVATAVAGAATLSNYSGTVTSEALVTAAAATYTLTLTNTKVTAASIVMVSLANGTNTQGVLALTRVTPAAGSVVIVVTNAHASQALNGTIKAAFAIVG